jgi:hypothetical protein
MVQRLDNDPATVEALTKVLYNTGNNTNPNYFKGSVLLTNLYNNADAKGKIGFETLVYFKEQGSADKGIYQCLIRWQCSPYIVSSLLGIWVKCWKLCNHVISTCLLLIPQ